MHGVSEARRRGNGQLDRRRVKAVMRTANIGEGPHATAKGLRHGYGVHAIGRGVPLNLLSRWMGHASLEVTALYADALGAEEQAIAAKMWNGAV